MAAASGEFRGRKVRSVDVEEGEEQQEGRVRVSAGGRGQGSSLRTQILHVSYMHDVCNATKDTDAV